jgi:hypothetical protein
VCREGRVVVKEKERASTSAARLRTSGNGGGCPIQLRPVFGCRQDRRWGPNSGGEPWSFRPAAGFRVPRQIGPQKTFFLVNIAGKKSLRVAWVLKNISIER